MSVRPQVELGRAWHQPLVQGFHVVGLVLCSSLDKNFLIRNLNIRVQDCITHDWSTHNTVLQTKHGFGSFGFPRPL